MEGEYAYLTPIDGGDEVFVALYLLPLGVDIGTLLICESFSFLQQFNAYEILELL